MPTESGKKAQEREACVLGAEQSIVVAKHSMGTSCQVVLYSSHSFSSSQPPSSQEVLSAIMKTRQDVSVCNTLATVVVAANMLVLFGEIMLSTRIAKVAKMQHRASD